MSTKDIHARNYIRNNETFADICNYYIYHGRPVIYAAQLREKDTAELIIPFNADHISIPIQKFRDILKSIVIKENDHATFVIVGIENQSEVHYAMTVRNMLYDAINYASQVTELSKINRKKHNLKSSSEFLSGLAKDDKIIPIITIVIYWGTNHWDGSRSLHEFLASTDADILKHVPDYKLNLIIPSEIEHFEQFQTDIRLVFQCLKCANDKHDLQTLMTSQYDAYSNLDAATAHLIAEFTNTKIDTAVSKGGRINMCKAIDDMVKDGESRGEIRGEIRGEARGEARGRMNTLFQLTDDRLLSIEDAAKTCGMTVEEFLTAKKSALCSQ